MFPVIKPYDIFAGIGILFVAMVVWFSVTWQIEQSDYARLVRAEKNSESAIEKVNDLELRIDALEEHYGS